MGAKRAARSGLPAPSSVLLRASPPFCFVCVNPFRSNKRTVHAPLFMSRRSPTLEQLSGDKVRQHVRQNEKKRLARTRDRGLYFLNFSQLERGCKNCTWGTSLGLSDGLFHTKL
ncbi:hypothetical protein IscW_ISCW006424 [Ixodes scapularis]|uniref:Uncharacterized protein n=1 Tax=Ixodes scapularis TaxID=6945 RepID=B7PLC9_IXOSC|nr:hypothetical protein IscW_ISCW006424 [Ixodes scapularis]|eukprot:XP_002434577.1 hypothetical protein IscW_ISCW006424 [Ixodes scapularis]